MDLVATILGGDPGTDSYKIYSIDMSEALTVHFKSLPDHIVSCISCLKE